MRGRVKNFRRTVGQQTTAISLKPRCVNVNAEAEEGHLGLSHFYSLMHMRLPFLPLSTAEEAVCSAEPLIEADWNYKAFWEWIATWAHQGWFEFLPSSHTCPISFNVSDCPTWQQSANSDTFSESQLMSPLLLCQNTNDSEWSDDDE